MRDVVEINDLHRTALHTVVWDVPALFLDLVFLLWIYSSLLQTMGDLKEDGQHSKHALYAALGTCMAAFVGFVSAATVILVLARGGAFGWPWQLYLVQTILWELLNLGVMVTVSILWAPSERSSLLVHSLQLKPSELDDDSDFDEDSAAANLAKLGDYPSEDERIDIELSCLENNTGGKAASTPMLMSVDD
jgi:hypothetical protein